MSRGNNDNITHFIKHPKCPIDVGIVDGVVRIRCCFCVMFLQSTIEPKGKHEDAMLTSFAFENTIFPLNSFECSASKVSRFFMKVLHHIVWQYRSAVPTPPLPTMCPGDKTPIVWPTCWMSRCVRCIRRRNNRGVIPCAAAKKKASDLEKSPELISRTFWGTGTGCWMVLGGFAT